MGTQTNPSSSAALHGRSAFPRVHGYELLSVLGEGAAGVVYEARQQGGREALAIKILHSYLARDEQVRGRFMREAEILASLEGPAVCPVLALGETDDTALPYMVMPKLEGQKLSDVEKSTLSTPDAVRLVCEILTALEAAHRAGVVHRDLKPDNVIVGHGRVTVVDFGMAKILRGSQEGPEKAELTTSGMIFGTPEYMAPEQARGETADPRCDVYAAGVILYELLSGSVPLQGENAILTLVKITREAPPPLHTRTSRNDVSEALEACVMHAIAKDRNDRYPSARTFRDALLVAMSHPERAAVVRPDHYFDTEGEAGLTLPISGRVRASVPTAPPSRRGIPTREPGHERDATHDARTFERKRELETLPDLRKDAPATPAPSRVTVNRRPPSSSAPTLGSQTRVPVAPAASGQLPTLAASAQHGGREATGHTPSYASRVPPSLAARPAATLKRTALLVWAVLACLAILAGIYLALGSSPP